MTPGPATPRLDGSAAETLARRHLERAGLRTLACNYRCRGGELDLVMQDGGCLVFVEVRYRHGTAYGRAEETVGATKQRRLVLAANHYLQRHGTAVARFDVVAIHPGGDGYAVKWIRDAFTA
ncbi:MAG TPA: YraN family protein [Gammaproteobacteria bacterium]